MLKRLSVENYALIDRLELSPGEHLNTITGETGAGKSILLGALGLLLGNRCDTSVILDGSRNCVVEGEFAVEQYGLEPFFAEYDLDYEEIAVVRRVITPAGKSRAYVNDLPVQLATLRELGSRLIDIHSQHQSLMIAGEGFRTGVLDSVAGHGQLLSDYRCTYADLVSARRELARVREEAARNSRDEEWLRHQKEELDAAALRSGEKEELEREMSELTHAGEIGGVLASAAAAFDDDETGILPRLKSLTGELERVGRFYPRGAQLAERLRPAYIELRDLGAELASEAGRIESDPERLQAVSERLDTIYSLEQKHRAGSVEELIALGEEFGRKLELIDGGSEAVATLEKKIAEAGKKAEELAALITARRMKAASVVGEYVVNTLSGLGMPGTLFRAEVARADALNADGADRITFLFSAGGNAPAAPVEKIASGGEVSRLMLALKSLVARSRSLPTIIFDEIDSGVSGRVADSMGNIIEELSHTMQVINITHLPQVAAKGETHFYVYKRQEGGTTNTAIVELTPQQRIEEIAKMLSGDRITDAALAQARLLLGAG